jgi:hypothetical protein
MEREASSRRCREAGRVALGMVDPFKLSVSPGELLREKGARKTNLKMIYQQSCIWSRRNARFLVGFDDLKAGDED